MIKTLDNFCQELEKSEISTKLIREFVGLRVKNACDYHSLVLKDFRKTLNRNSEILKFLMIKTQK